MYKKKEWFYSSLQKQRMEVGFLFGTESLKGFPMIN
jgi:hypothetical protein